MPSVESWQQRPLSVIESIFENRKNNAWINEVHSYFETRLNDADNIAMVPSLNDLPIHDLMPNSLVRFRCMIQDCFDNEFFLETYGAVDSEKTVKVQKTNCFQDVIRHQDNYDIQTDVSHSKTGMRQVLYCVSIPGETDWVKLAWRNAFRKKPDQEIHERLGSSSIKRSRNDDYDMETESLDSTEQRSGESCKRAKPVAGKDTKDNIHWTLEKNHPLPGETGPACIVKVYDESAEFKVNEVLEFFGVLSVDPILSQTHDATAQGVAGKCGIDSGNEGESRAHNPPASLVPRLHVVMERRLHHINPELPLQLSPEFFSSQKQNAPTVRSCLLALLEKALLGDSLAAEYLLLHLLARVYARKDMLALGKFSLNISGIPPHSAYPSILSRFLKDLVTKLHNLVMSVDKFNTLRFMPAKNYETNRLDSGILQLSKGTHLVLDESALKPGTMDANGIRNIQALKNLLLFQKVDYDFQFHEAPFECDVNVIVLSEGKSLLPCDCQVQLTPSSGFPENLEEYFAFFCAQCPTDFLTKIRSYISCTRLLDYELSEVMTKSIQDDFVAARRQDPKVTADDLHAWLVLARLLSLSHGQPTLSQQRWDRVRALETQRKERLPHP